jgi:hypothetical protein
VITGNSRAIPAEQLADAALNATHCDLHAIYPDAHKLRPSRPPEPAAPVTGSSQGSVADSDNQASRYYSPGLLHEGLLSSGWS